MRLVRVLEPEVYVRSQMQVSDSRGRDDPAYMVPKCPVALSELDSDVGLATCAVVRKGTVTRHGVIASGFPEAISGVPKYYCSTHAKSFTILSPAVHEALPADALVQPELVVLTNKLVLHKSAYLSVALQVGDKSPGLHLFHSNVF